MYVLVVKVYGGPKKKIYCFSWFKRLFFLPIRPSLTRGDTSKSQGSVSPDSFSSSSTMPLDLMHA